MVDILKGNVISFCFFVRVEERVNISVLFFFSSRRRHTRYWRDWSSDVCSSDLGSVLNPAMDRPEVWDQLPQIRVEEMARAREILGVEQEFLGFIDSGLPEGDPLPPLPQGCFALVPLEEAAAPLVELIRRFRPQVVVTYDERGGYPHPDHIKTHEISVYAFEAAGDPDRYPDLGEP